MSALGKRGRVLVVDDEDPIRALLALHLAKQEFEVVTARDARDALESLARTSVDLVLSDVRMPGMDGISLLAEIVRRHPQVGVIMLTGCEDVSIAVRAMKIGAVDYILKPFRLSDVDEGIRLALERRRELLAGAERVRELEEAVERQTEHLRDVLADLQDASESTLEALVAALDAREHETLAHSRRVGDYAVHLGGAMGLEKPELEVIRRGAMLHDIGKIGIPDRILLNPGQLTDAEWREMRRHPEIGYWIVRGVDTLRPAAEIVLCHHERYDGAGYPRGLRGDEVALGARIFSVVDSLDAITSDRPYRQGDSYQAAREEIAAHAGTQFDPAVVAHFLEVRPEAWSRIRENSLAAVVPAGVRISRVVLT